MGKARVFLNKIRILSLPHSQFFLVCRKTKSVYQINSYLSSVGVEGIFCQIKKKKSEVGNFLNLKLNTRLSAEKIRTLDVDAFREEGKRFKFQIHLKGTSGRKKKLSSNERA